MKIVGVECIPVRVPIRPELAIRAKGGSHSESPFLLAKVHTDEGITGHLRLLSLIPLSASGGAVSRIEGVEITSRGAP